MFVDKLYQNTQLTRQTVYVSRNIEERSCNNRCDGKAVNITQSESVFVDLVIHNAVHMRHTVICGLPRIVL